MTKPRFVMFFLLFLLSFSISLQAASKEEKEEEKRQEYRKQVADKLAELNGTSWDVRISSSTGKGVLAGEDTLTFQDQKFSSEKASKEGWASTNYTLTVQEEGPTVWETMQTSEKAGVAFWRGEWKEDVMTGVISRQIEDRNEEYSFSSSAMNKISPSSGESESAEAEIISPVSQTPLVSGSVEAVSKTVPETMPSEEPQAQQAAKSEPPKKTSWFF